VSVTPIVATEPGVDAAAESRRGVLYGVTAYGCWGLFPLFWVLLEPAGAVEILANRIAWTLVVVLAVLWLVPHVARLAGRPRPEGRPMLRAVLRDRRRIALLALAAVIVSVNWGIYIWGVNNGHVVETSLGYFVNPLVTVLAGVLVLGERLRPLQWVAVALGTVAVVVLTVGYGQLPWIALTLAFSFGAYGLIKKYVGVGAVESLTVETAVLFTPALAYVVVLEVSGSGTLLSEGAGHTTLMATGGIVTAIPLLAFGAAANRVPLSLLGLMQYLAPVIQFACGVLVFHEHMSPLRWVGFAVVWAALAVLTWDGLRAARRSRAALAPCEPT
jgi:chloramphenicol-sensitive protein RarD